MRVQLIVVQGKHDGKVISLAGPLFRIGRGETCHLRPNSERVSREHAEISVGHEGVTLRDLGSRNGTLVNGKAITDPYPLKDRDLVQVGPLMFTVSIEATSSHDRSTHSTPPSVVASLPRNSTEAPSEPWKLAEPLPPGSGPLGSETIMIPAFQDTSSPRVDSSISSEEEDDTAYERQPVVEGETAEDIPQIRHHETAAPLPRRPRDSGRRVSSAAAEILRKMMERGRSSS